MARYACPAGHEWKAKSSLSASFHPSEKRCPEPGCGLPAKFGRNAPKSTGYGLKAAPETPEHRAARERFDRLVLEWPCWGKRHREGHVCRGPKDAHHLVPKDWISRTFSDLPEDELLAILFEPVIGMPACRFVLHDALETRADIVLLHELRDEVRLFCLKIDRRYGANHPSMLTRLELESPPARSAAA